MPTKPTAKATMTKVTTNVQKTPTGTKVTTTKGKPTQMKMSSITEKQYKK